MQTTNAAGIELIKGFEGFKAKAYKLAGENYYTIGYGHSFDTKINQDSVWTQSYATIMLRNDLKVYEKYVNELAAKYKFTFNDNQFSALVSYTYNRGRGGLDQLLRNSKTVQEVGSNMVVYWGTAQLYKSGLVRRRKSEQSLFFKGSNITQASNSNQLSVDGYWGKSTTLALQKALNTHQDGIISGQHKNGITRNITGVKYGTTGSTMIKALQKKLNVPVDGFLGMNTIKSLQKYLVTYVDGEISKPSAMIKELQKRLNNNKF